MRLEYAVDSLNDSKAKQDCELNGFNRLATRIKQHFPKLKIILLLDNLYACANVFTQIRKLKWEFMIKLPARVKALYEPLKAQRHNNKSIPSQPYYRERKQGFHWINNIEYKDNMVHVVGCIEKWPSVSKETGDLISEFSEHTWVSSLSLSIDNVHTLCNLAARKRAFIEDSFNTEKNRGYYYQHIFSYNWNAMQAFHYLMRLAHAINALSEFTKKLKKYIRDIGWSNTFTRIFDAIKHHRLSDEWIRQQQKTTTIQLRLQLE